MKKQCMVIFVENNSGVLARVSSLFMQRGFNIDSLTVSSTENPKISRITIMATGDQKTFSQILKQTDKLIETKMIFSVEPSFSLIRELLLVKFNTENADVEALKKVIEDFGARVIDVTSGCMVSELSAPSSLIDDFLDATKAFEKMEICRSGAIAMEQGRVDYDIN
jgi:acetolactate synthase-1/3 small subunit